MKKVHLTLILVISIFFLGCSSKTSKPTVLERDNVSAISNTADLQMTFIKKHGDLDRYCGSRQSDVADTRSSGATLGVGTIGKSENIGEGSSQGALSLGGRSPSVLIVREMLYRACELTMNLNTDTKTTIEVYSKFLDSIEKITTSQTEVGTTSVGEKANTTVTMTENSDEAVTPSTSNDTEEDDSDTSED